MHNDCNLIVLAAEQAGNRGLGVLHDTLQWAAVLAPNLL